jgi:hypothetical protein
LYTLLTSPLFATCPTHLIFLDFKQSTLWYYYYLASTTFAC